MVDDMCTHGIIVSPDEIGVPCFCTLTSMMTEWAFYAGVGVFGRDDAVAFGADIMPYGKVVVEVFG
jgi:hypothetical protein